MRILSVPDSRFSIGHNMSTSIASTIPASLAAGNTDSASSAIKKKELQQLKKTQRDVDMNFSNFVGTDVPTTREGYVAFPNATDFVVAVTCGLEVCLRPVDCLSAFALDEVGCPPDRCILVVPLAVCRQYGFVLFHRP
jgi:hypothetical protein